MVKKIYVAGPWVYRSHSIECAKDMRAAGFEVVSRWHDKHHETSPDDSTGLSDPPDLIRSEALQDVEDVRAADVLVVLNLQKSEGKAVETGIALERRIPFVVVGPQLNIFTTLAYAHVETIDQAIEAIKCLPSGD